jgi:acyl-CoA thioester hydrolase
LTPSYTARIPIRWRDMDALGHLNNADYLTLFEQARTEWLLSLPGHEAMWNAGSGPVIAEASIRYRRPIVHPATVVITITFDPPRRASVVFRYDVRTEAAPDVVCATGETTLVWVDYATGRPISLPEPLTALLTRT